MSQTMEWIEDRVCTVCGKRFSVLYPHLWRYKEPCGGNGHYRYFCSWKCLRANEKGVEDMEKLKKDGTPAKKPGPKPKTKTPEQVPEIRLDGPIKIKTPDAGMIEIETPVAETLGDALNGMADAAADFFEKCGDMGLEVGAPEPVRKVTKPLAYDGFTVTAIKRDYGRYARDTFNGTEYLDYETNDGEEISMPVETWKEFLKELYLAAKVLGVEL